MDNNTFVNRWLIQVFFSKTKKKHRGVVALEVCFTLPIVIYLIFFTIEMIRINITQDALQSICEEATYLTIAHDYDSGPELIGKIDDIVEKYRPAFIPKKGPGYTSAMNPIIRWTYIGYADVETMLAKSPYGGDCITYPQYEHSANVNHSTPAYSSSSQYIPSMGMQCVANPENYQVTKAYLDEGGAGLPTNSVFTLTVVCNYPFSSSLVKMLFNGGVNTKIGKILGSNEPVSSQTHAKGSMYLLWARGAGIVNAK